MCTYQETNKSDGGRDSLFTILRRLPIPAKIAFAFFISSLIPALTAVFLLHEQAIQKAVEYAHSELEIRARSKNELISQRIARIERVVAGIADTGIIRGFLESVDTDPDSSSEFGGDAEDIVHAIQEQEWGVVHNIFLTDAYGEVVLSPPHGQYEIPCRAPMTMDEDTRVRVGTLLGLFLGDEQCFRSVDNGPCVSSFHAFGDSDHNHQLVMHPVFNEAGEMIGTVAAEVAIDSILELLSEGFSLGDTGRIFLATRSGRPVTNLKTESREPITSPGLASAIAEHRLQRGCFINERGTEVFGVYMPSEKYPWLIGIEIDEAEIMRPIMKQRAGFIALIAGVAMILGVVGTLIGLWFGLPLRQLAKDADRVTEGDLDTPVRITRPKDEIGRLQRSTETLREHIAGQIRSRDSIIEHRTIALEQACRAMAESQERFELALDGSRDALFDWDLSTDSVFYTPRWAELLGLSEDELHPTLAFLIERIVPDELPVFEAQLTHFIEKGSETFESTFRLIHRDGSHVWVLFRAAAIRDENGRARRISGSVADISEIKAAQDKLKVAAETDRLTGLPNRAVLTRRIEEALARSKRNGKLCAVLFFDFDRFKVINDSLGHDIGDALLISIAERFRRTLREVDTSARFGGDEFVVLLDGIASVDVALAVGEKLLGAFSEPHEIEGHRVVSTASIGLVTNELGYDSAENMIRDADVAMYQAKLRGRGRVVVFDQSMHDAALDRLSLEASLRTALDETQFLMEYQPIVDLNTGLIVGAESLIRWDHSTRGRISPDKFIYIAEDTGLIVPIGSWVIEHVCAQLSDWKARGITPPGFTVNINVSKRQLLEDGFCESLVKCVHSHRLETDEVKIEVTETTIVDNRAGLSGILQGLRERGFRIVMDDFGTGHSSLSGLHQLPIDQLKIDQSFIKQVNANRRLIAITSSIVSLAEHLSLSAVGEGIETVEDLALLQTLGCQFGQGYYFSRSVPAEMFECLLEGKCDLRESA